MSNHAPAVLIFTNNSFLLQAFPDSGAAANHSTLDNIPIFFLFFFVSLSYREAEHTLAVLIVMLTEKSTVTMAAENATSKMVTTTGVAASSK